MDEAARVLVEQHEGVAIIRFNRPAAGNAIDVELAKGLLECAIAVEDDAAVRCIVLTGAGPFFCVGGDVRSMGRGAVSAFLNEVTAYLHAAITRLMRMKKPLVTAINGPAAGAGFSLAVLGDIAIMSRAAHLSLAYSQLGFSPDGGATWLLPRLVGLRHAQEIALTNRRVAADEAVRLGLVTQAVSASALHDTSMAIARRLAAGPTEALGMTRQLIAQSLSTSLEEQMAVEADCIAACARTPHGREGVSAFLGKRAPRFSGL